MSWRRLLGDSWIEALSEEGRTIVRLFGDLDAAVVPGVREHWTARVSAELPCCVDLGHLEFCSVACARLLADLVAERAAPVTIHHPGAGPSRALGLAGVTWLDHPALSPEAGNTDAGTVDVLANALDEAIRLARADMGDAQVAVDGTLRLVADRRCSGPFVDFFRVIDDGDASCGRAAGSGHLVAVEDVATSPLYRQSPALQVMLRSDVRSCLSVPVVSAGEVIAVVSVLRHRPSTWDGPTRRALQALADTTAQRLADLPRAVAG